MTDVKHTPARETGYVVTANDWNAQHSVVISKEALDFGTWEKIAEVVPSSNVDYVDFTDLDINTDGFYVLIFHLKNPLSAGSEYNVFVNGDNTPTNYYDEYLIVSASSVIAGRENLSSCIFLAVGERGFAEVWIARDPDGYFRWTCVSSRYTGSGVQLNVRAGCKTGTVTNITSIRVAASQSGGIAANSKFILARVRTK